jgi:predicted ATP-dependent serine protease
MKQKYTCIYCKHQSDTWLPYNICCSSAIGIRYGAYGLAPIFRRKQKEVTSNIESVSTQNTKWIHIDGTFDKFLSDEVKEESGRLIKVPHGLAEGSINLIHGESGSGKTAMLIYWAGQIAQSGYTVIYNSTEVPISKIKERLQYKLPNSFKGWSGLEIEGYYNLIYKLDGIHKPYLLIIDSINDLQLPIKASSNTALLKTKVDYSINFAHKEHITLLLAMHETKDNRIKGDSEILHASDNIFKITKLKGMSQIECEKGRDYDRDAKIKVMLISGKGMEEYRE